MEIIRKTLAITLIGVFSQASMAQNQEVTEALQEIASIVISINHFPSDENKTVLERISGNNNLPQGIRLIASSVSDIQHSPNEQGKHVMSQIQAASRAPDAIKSLAAIIANFNHTASDEEKASLALLFQLP